MGLKASKKADITTPPPKDGKKLKRKKSKKGESPALNGENGIEEVAIQDKSEDAQLAENGPTGITVENGEAKTAETGSAGSHDAPTDIVQDSPDKEGSGVAVISEVLSPNSPASPIGGESKPEQSVEVSAPAAVETESGDKKEAEVPKSPIQSEKETEVPAEAEPKVETPVEEAKVEAPQTEEPKAVVEIPKVENQVTEAQKTESPVEAASPISKEPKAITLVEEPQVQSPVTVEAKAEPQVQSPISVEAKEQPQVLSPVTVEEPQIQSPVTVEEPQIQSPVTVEEPQVQSPVTVEEPQVQSSVTTEAKEEPQVQSPATEVPKKETPVEDLKVQSPVEEESKVGTPSEVPKSESPAGEIKVQSPVAEEPEAETPAEESKVASPVAETPVVEESKLQSPVAEAPPMVESPAEEPKTEVPVSEEPKAEAGETRIVSPAEEIHSEPTSPKEALANNSELPSPTDGGPVSPVQETQSAVEDLPPPPPEPYVEPLQEVSSPQSPVEAEKASPAIETSAVEENGMLPNGGLNGDLHHDDISSVELNGDSVNGPTDVPTTLMWSKGGDQVAVSGDFNKWEDSCVLQKQDDMFCTKIKLPKGTHHIKYIVDGIETVDESQPIVELDGHGQVNVVTV